jgi:hypothetical protein
MICSKHEIETALGCACISLFAFILHGLLPRSTSRHSFFPGTPNDYFGRHMPPMFSRPKSDKISKV